MWHDGGGVSPSWFLNYVKVKDIVGGSSWTFLAQCWLAVDEGDGRVERKLLALHRKLTFREVSASTYFSPRNLHYKLKLECTLT